VEEVPNLHLKRKSHFTSHSKKKTAILRQPDTSGEDGRRGGTAEEKKPIGAVYYEGRGSRIDYTS